MSKVWIFLILPIFFILIIISFFLWSFGGLKEYLDIKNKISELPRKRQELINKDFLNSDNMYVDTGVLATINLGFKPGVLFWGSKGLRYLQVDEYAVYSHFGVCNPASIEAFKNGKSFSVERNIYINLNQLKEKSKKGDYVLITIAGPENDGKRGYLRELKIHDWFPFMPTDISKQCEK